MAMRRLTAADFAFVAAECQGVNRLPEREKLRRLRLALLKCCDVARSDPSWKGREVVAQLEKALALVDRSRLLVEMDELTRER